ncbi:hypothetical protein TNIN_161421 [Trichonephila inaurata madagascariensis]|uniref:Uncharacterized protein n=1 Tax=Trichonephila inaurata madagascariensis TaxID=2747483 RepID=A0A8X6X7D7_9ARAC|nr:hypothetical protein TNIN_161421 [Trichonephila inaurata madagascariensis]
MINDPEKGIAKKCLMSILSREGEKGEIITVVTGCNAEGNFLARCSFKDKRKKLEFEDGTLPPSGLTCGDGRNIRQHQLKCVHKMSEESFYPRKEPGKFFWRQALSSLIHNKRNCKVSRLQFGSPQNAAWSKADTVRKLIFRFSATGTYHYNPEAIPHHMFANSDGSCNDRAVDSTGGAWDMPIPAVVSTSRVSGCELSPSVASINKEHGIPCLEPTNSIPLVRNRKRSGRKKQT